MDIATLAGHILPVAGLMAGAGIELRWRFWGRVVPRVLRQAVAWTTFERG